MLKIAPGLKVDTLSYPVVGKLHHAHCSGIVTFPDGEVLVVFYWTIKEAAKDQAIFSVRRAPGVSKWSAVEKVPKEKSLLPRFEGNPAIWVAPDTGKLWLFYVTSWGGWSTCTARYRTSDDRGHTWTKSKKIFWRISRAIKNPPILTSRGWYVLPASVEFRDLMGVFYISQDRGQTWEESSKVTVAPQYIPPGKQNGHLVEQPTIIERRDGSLLALFRIDRPLTKMFQAESSDGGRHWTMAVPSALPNPAGGFHMLRLKSGAVAIIYNHAPTGTNHGYERNPLSVAISDDDGRSWGYRRNLCEFHLDAGATESPDVQARSFQYPTMVQDEQGTLHATWSFAHPETQDGTRYNFQDIQYTSFTEAWVREHKFFEDPWQL